MTTIDIQDKHLLEIKRILSEHIKDTDVWAYGSRINETAHDASDLDLVLRNNIDLNIEQENISLIKQALSESSIPIIIDIVDWARLPNSFQKEIKNNYITVISNLK